MKTTFNLSWAHGMGDTVNFAHAIPLWLRRGYTVNFWCPNQHQVLFDAAGCGRVQPDQNNNIFTDWHPYRHAGVSGEPMEVWSRNKVAFSLQRPEPLPLIGMVWDLWPEVLDTKLCLTRYLTDEGRGTVDGFLGDRPFVLLHTRGYSLQDEKNYSPDMEAWVQLGLLRNIDEDIVLLDRHNKVNRIEHERIRVAPINTGLPELAYLIERARLLVGIDSGPLHLARLTGTPALGVWFHLSPGEFALPRSQTLHIADRPFPDRNHQKAEAFNIIQKKATAEAVVELATRLLAGESPTEIRGNSVHR